MQEIDAHLQRIESKLQQLLKEYQYTQREVHRLQKENDQLQQLLAEKTSVANELSQKVDVLKLTASGLSDQSVKELEKRINSYLKEIDKCLALLHT